MTPERSSRRLQPEARAKSYGKAVPAWAAGFGVGAILASPLAQSNQQRLENIVLAFLMGGLIGFIRTADRRREYAYVVALGRAARGALGGPILLVAVAIIAELGAWLLGLPASPVAELFSWKWWIGSMVVTGATAGGRFLVETEPGEVLPYARKAGEGFFDGTGLALIWWLVTYAGPKPWQLPELTQIGREIGLFAAAGGVAGAVLTGIGEAMRRQFRRMRGVGNVGGTIGGEAGRFIAPAKGLVSCVVMLGTGAWILSVEPRFGLSRMGGWCVILLGVSALISTAQEFIPAFHTSPRPRNQAGDARDATEGDARQAAGVRSPADDRRFPD